MGLLKIFEDVPDARRAQGQRYQLNHVLFLSVLSILSGARSYRDISRFIYAHLSRFRGLLGIKWKRSPAHNTVRDILQGLKKEVFEWHFRKYSQALSTETSSDISKKIVVVDGKALRGSFDHFNDKRVAHLISAYCTQDQLILGHMEVSDKSNEIPAVQSLLAGLGLKNCIYTLDAMHCQKKRSR